MRATHRPLCLALALSCRPCAQTKQALPGITNFTKVDAMVACGGATEIATLDALEEGRLQVRDQPAHGHRAGREHRAEPGEGQGARPELHPHPVQRGSPDPKVVDQFLAAIANKANQPVFIHCGSAKRVGAVWLVKRVLQDGYRSTRPPRKPRPSACSTPASRSSRWSTSPTTRNSMRRLGIVVAAVVAACRGVSRRRPRRRAAHAVCRAANFGGSTYKRGELRRLADVARLERPRLRSGLRLHPRLLRARRLRLRGARQQQCHDGDGQPACSAVGGGIQPYVAGRRRPRPQPARRLRRALRHHRQRISAERRRRPARGSAALLAARRLPLLPHRERHRGHRCSRTRSATSTFWRGTPGTHARVLGLVPAACATLHALASCPSPRAPLFVDSPSAAAILKGRLCGDFSDLMGRTCQRRRPA